MPILLQHHRVMPNGIRKVALERIGPPNTRMQLTAFGARDRRYFKAILCRVPSAATDAQHVGPQPHHTYTQFQGGLSLRPYSHTALGSHEMPGEVYNLPSVLNMSFCVSASIFRASPKP